VGSVTSAKATSGRSGHAIVLRYMASDHLSPTATAVRVVVRNAHGKTVKTFSLGKHKTGAWLHVSWTPKARGTYHYYVYAKYLAGNNQSKLGSARVAVR
jgi:hypothetical protein